MNGLLQSSTRETFLIFPFASFPEPQRARASCLGRDRAGRSNRTESAETRCAQRRHGLGRPPRNPASTSHGRRRSGVHLFGRASRWAYRDPKNKNLAEISAQLVSHASLGSWPALLRIVSEPGGHQIQSHFHVGIHIAELRGARLDPVCGLQGTQCFRRDFREQHNFLVNRRRHDRERGTWRRF